MILPSRRWGPRSKLLRDHTIRTWQNLGSDSWLFDFRTRAFNHCPSAAPHVLTSLGAPENHLYFCFSFLSYDSYAACLIFTQVLPFMIKVNYNFKLIPSLSISILGDLSLFWNLSVQGWDAGCFIRVLYIYVALGVARYFPTRWKTSMMHLNRHSPTAFWETYWRWQPCKFRLRVQRNNNFQGRQWFITLASPSFTFRE